MLLQPSKVLLDSSPRILNTPPSTVQTATSSSSSSSSSLLLEKNVQEAAAAALTQKPQVMVTAQTADTRDSSLAQRPSSSSNSPTFSSPTKNGVLSVLELPSWTVMPGGEEDSSSDSGRSDQLEQEAKGLYSTTKTEEKAVVTAADSTTAFGRKLKKIKKKTVHFASPSPSAAASSSPSTTVTQSGMFYRCQESG
jgi:hypothetical protein